MDWQLIQPIFHWLSDHPVWSGLFVFLIALTESLVIVGLVVPGTVLMFGVGTLVGTGVLDVKLVLLLAFIGAVLGDGISFWFGARYRDQISGFWPFKNNPKILAKGKDFFLEHGGKSIFFGRFVGPVRPVIPAVAGMMHMPAQKFFAINVISAAGWAPFYLIPGILFGSSIGLASAIGSRLVIILLSIFIGSALTVFVVKKSMKIAMPKLEGWFEFLLHWSGKGGVFGKIINSLIDPNKSTKIALVSTVFILISFVFFFTTFILSLWSPWILHMDMVVKNIFSLVRSVPGDNLMWAIQNSFSWLILMLAVTNILGGLHFSGLKKAFNYLVGLLIATLLSSVVLLLVYEFSAVELIDSASFFHLSLLVSSLLFYAVISCESQPVQNRWLYYSVSVLMLFCFSFSDIYFSFLSLSQILIAISLSALWVLIFSLAYRRHEHRVISVSFISRSTAIICVFAATLSIFNFANRDILVAKKSDIHVISTSEWIANKWQGLAKNRSDVFGKEKINLNLQWQGTIAEIERSLKNAGWQPSKKVTFKSLLYWLAPEPELAQIVRLPQTHKGKTESILYIKDDKKKNAENNFQTILQLWPTSITNEAGLPVWLGAISKQRLISNEGWLSLFRVENIKISQFLNEETIFSEWNTTITKRTNDETNTVLLVYK